MPCAWNKCVALANDGHYCPIHQPEALVARMQHLLHIHCLDLILAHPLWAVEIARLNTKVSEAIGQTT